MKHFDKQLSRSIDTATALLERETDDDKRALLREWLAAMETGIPDDGAEAIRERSSATADILPVRK